MKNVIALLLLLIIGYINTVHAQLENGRFWVGASSSVLSSGNDFSSISFSNTTNKSQNRSANGLRAFSFNLNPKVGYIFNQNLVIGLDILAGYSRQEEVQSQSIENHRYSAGSFIRYYFRGARIIPFLEASGSYGNNKAISSLALFGLDSLSNSKFVVQSRIINYTAGAGLAIPVGKRSFIDLMAVFSSSNEKSRESDLDNFHRVTQQ